MPSFGTIVWFLCGVLLFRDIWKIGLAMLRSMATAPPPPPPAGEMRRINVRYRCTVCGTELRMVMAPDEDPPPPRHCMEDMEFMTPRFE
jgi:hypothetical protein